MSRMKAVGISANSRNRS